MCCVRNCIACFSWSWWWNTTGGGSIFYPRLSDGFVLTRPCFCSRAFLCALRSLLDCDFWGGGIYREKARGRRLRWTGTTRAAGRCSPALSTRLSRRSRRPSRKWSCARCLTGVCSVCVRPFFVFGVRLLLRLWSKGIVLFFCVLDYCQLFVLWPSVC